MAESAWRKLAADDLWVKSEFTEDSYTIWVTDLCQLWSEELAGDDLRWRANKDRIPIDVDDPQNLAALLRHLATAVEEGVLQPARKARFFDLAVDVHLPKLATCSWKFKLEEQAGDQFRTNVTKPLLCRVEAFGKREDELINCLRDKDHAIDRLLDVLEKHSVDLADVFPSLASHASVSRRAISREEAEKLIPSLQTFTQRPSSALSDRRFSANGNQSSKMTGTQRAKGSDIDGEAFDNADVEIDTPSSSTKEKQKSANHVQLPKRTEIDSGSIAQSKGIKRSIGQRRPSKAVSNPLDDQALSSPVSHARTRAQNDGDPTTIETDDASSTAAESPVHDSPARSGIKPQAQAQAKTKGIRRTLGQRRKSPEVKQQLPKQEIHNEHKSPARHVSDELSLDEDEIADRRREELQRKLAVEAAHKPKKRKF